MTVGLVLVVIYIGYFVIDAYRQRRFKKKIDKELKKYDETYPHREIEKYNKDDKGYISFEESGFTDYKKWYHDIYLNSPHWGKLKKVALQRADYKCQMCSGKNIKLNVHHNTYKNLGHEYITDLVVLCERCHSKFHDK